VRPRPGSKAKPAKKMTNNLPLIRLSSINPFLMELRVRNIDAATVLREGSLDLDGWEPIEKAASEANTVGGLLNRFIVQAAAHSSATRFFLRSEADYSIFGFSRVVDPTIQPAQNDAFYLGFIARMLIHATGDRWRPSQVLFTISDPDAIPPVHEQLRIAKGDRMGVQARFPTVWLLKNFRKRSFNRSNDTADATLLPGSLIDSVRVALVSHLQETDLTISKAAVICGYTTRRLSQALRQQGTTVAKEIAKLRAERARRDLRESDHRVAEIARTVGFTDPTVFSRAFKNWTGQSPQEYRKTHR
jgi:AraC-like DNA-binding protein